MSKRVLVTGSSRGIGRAIAEKLAEDGWSVALHYVQNEAEASDLKSKLGDACSGVYKADLSVPESIPKFFGGVVADGELHAVVNNAGVLHSH